MKPCRCFTKKKASVSQTILRRITGGASMKNTSGDFAWCFAVAAVHEHRHRAAGSWDEEIDLTRVIGARNFALRRPGRRSPQAEISRSSGRYFALRQQAPLSSSPRSNPRSPFGGGAWKSHAGGREGERFHSARIYVTRILH
jgi:hypothetical protein